MIILTGGAGFIGSCFLAKLNKKGINDVVVVDHLDESGNSRNLEGKKYTDYVEKDEFLKRVIENRLPRASYVVLMGACSSTILTDEAYYMKNNYEYSKTLAKWAFSNDIPFMYASSAATYGDGSLGYSDDNETTRKLKPLNFYGNSKQLFDLWILDNDYEDKATGLKFFNVFGPNEYHKDEMMSVICKRFKDVRDKGVIKLFKSYRKDYKDGEQKRDFVYVKDCIDVMWYLFKNPKVTGIFNLGTGKARSWNDIANAMFAALDEKTNIEYIEMPEYIRPRYQYFTEAKMGKLKEAGCDVEFRPLEDSIKDYIGRYLATNAIL